PGREHDHGDVGVGPQAPAHFEAVDGAGQADVEDDEAGGLVAHGVETLLAGAGLDDAEPLLAKVELHQIGDVLVVLDHYDGARGRARAHAVIVPCDCERSMNVSPSEQSSSGELDRAPAGTAKPTGLRPVPFR